MADLTQVLENGSSRGLLLLGAGMIYAGSRAGVAALAGKGDFVGKRAIGHWIPIAAAAIAATALRRDDLALAIIFSTSVACLSLFLGAIAMVAPGVDSPASLRRLWPFVLPAALLTLLAGFSANLNWIHAIMLLIEGAVLLLAWRELGHTAEIEAHEKATPGTESILAACVLLSLVGGVAGVLGAMRVTHDFSMVSDSTVIVAILGPLMVLPMLPSGAALAHRNRAWVAITSGVGVVLLNLCVLLPGVICLSYLAHAVHQVDGSWLHWRMDSLWTVGPMPFSWITWRVDNVLLVLLGFVLIPTAWGKWRLGRPEGATLIGVYVAYVLMEAAAGLRS